MFCWIAPWECFKGTNFWPSLPRHLTTGNTIRASALKIVPLCNWTWHRTSLTRNQHFRIHSHISGYWLLYIKVTIKRATFLQNVLKSDVARFTTRVQTCLAANKVAWILTSDWIKLRRSHAIRRIYVTCCKTGLSWPVKRATWTDSVARSIATLYFLHNYTACFVARQVWFVGGKAGNIAIQLV